MAVRSACTLPWAKPVPPRHPGRKERCSAASPGERCPPHRPGQGHRRRRTPLPRTPPPDRRRPLRLRLPAFWLRPAAWGLQKQQISPVCQGLGPEGEELILQLRHPLLGGGQLLRLPFCGGQGVLGFYRQQLGHGAVLVVYLGEIPVGPRSAENLQPHPLPKLLAGEDLDNPHLTGPAHVGAAAGAAVRPGEGHDPHLAGKRFLAAVVQTASASGAGKVMSTGVSCQITSLAAFSAAMTCSQVSSAL